MTTEDAAETTETAEGSAETTEDTAASATADGLRAQRDEVLDALSGLAPDDPDAPELCARAGFLGFLAFMEDWRPEDLSQAAEAFDVAFRAPGDSADWSLWRAAYAHVTAFRYEADPRLELLDEALRRYEEVGRCAGLDDAVVLGVRRNQGQLCLQRKLRHGGGAADAEAAVAHYGAVLEAGHPSSDLPEARYGRGAALTEFAFASGTLLSRTIDRAGLEEAAAELDRALSEARQRPGDEPPWAKDATIRSAYVHGAVWSTWPDPQQAAAVEEKVLRVLDDPETEALLGPAHFDGFGKLLYEQSTLRGDTEGRERAIALIRRAIAEWRPEREGSVARTALCLAVFLQARYYDDKDVRRLHEVTEVANLILAEGRSEEDRVSRTVYAGGQMMAGWARFLLQERGLVPDSDEATSAAVQGLMNAVEEGDLYIDHSGRVEGMPGWSAGATAADELIPRFNRGFEAWSGTESEERRADAALELLRYLPHMPMFFDRAKEKDALIACVLAFRPDDPDWQRQAHAAVGNVRLRDAAAGRGAQFDEIVDHFTRAGARPPTGAPGASEDGADAATDAERQHQHAADIGYIQALGARSQHAATGDDRDAARAEWARVRHSPQVTEHNRRLMDAKFAAVDAEQAVARGDVAAADRHIRIAAEARDGLAHDHPARAELGTVLEELLYSRDQLARTLGVPAAPPLADRPTADRLRAEARRLEPDRQARVLGDTGAARLARASDARDPAAFQEAMELLQEAYDLAAQGSDDGLRYATALGGGHCALAEAEPDAAARDRSLARGVDFLETVLRGCGGPEHRLYAHAGLTLAGAHRFRGDHASSRRIGLDALRGHAWAALLQSGTGHAAQAAASATYAALEVAAWCLDDNALADAVQALDACRGLVLHAATTSSTVPERLLAAGRQDLAEEWRAAATDTAPDPSGAPPTVPSSLRRRVLAVLTTADGGPQDRLLNPPTTTEIADALRASSKDALVYLVPASEGAGGTAVVVTSTGDIHAVPLPLLTSDAAPLRDYDPAATAARDVGPVPGGVSGGGPLLSGEGDFAAGAVRGVGSVPGVVSGDRPLPSGERDSADGAARDVGQVPQEAPGDRPEPLRARDSAPAGAPDLGPTPGADLSPTPGPALSPAPGASPGPLRWYDLPAAPARDVGSVPGGAPGHRPPPLRERDAAAAPARDVGPVPGGAPGHRPPPLGERDPAAMPARDLGPVPGGAPGHRPPPLREHDPATTPARDLGPVPGTPPAHRPPPLRAQLDRLCAWAWHAAVKPLFDTLDTLDSFDTPAGRGPRLVLVPMGTLGLVPWHAAWAEGPDGRRRYALAESEISYAASARLLCEVAARTVVPHTGAALVVGDPTGDLRYAGEEADAVQRVFYPRGQFLGRRAGAGGTGTGTPREVVSWLTRDGGDDGAVLHLACHATVTPSARRSSHLSLYGGELSAEELTEAVGAGRRGRLGLVLLAACRSHVSGHGHNEAYSLATAFLVAGARSVVGSLWPVPDDATSVLMFMAHHYLRAEGEPPARALRRAQLWMVDPDRVLPPTLPPSLAFRARHVDPDDLSAWAGFTHLGQ
ncbi:CHAT domain-containing protein [Streptomyces sp. NPDC127108]|uniref:CHAT domain-containing protein n=1 Tax=Streptomyces sp. NPDC127108 TaxID=3345361 RepID=UPI00362D3DAF